MNPVVMITGAAGALGRAVAQRFAADGAQLVLLDRDEQVLAGLFPGAALVLAPDITDEASVGAAVARALERLGRIDVLVHVAGGFEMGETVATLSRASWQRMMDLNAWSFVALAHAVVPAMQRQRGGVVVAVSAAAAGAGQGLKGAYIASKSALQRLVETLAQEVAADGLRVLSVAPTTLDTPANRAAMPDADRGAWVSTEQAAETIAFAASPAGGALGGPHLRLGR
ncbi:MAG: SDR family NAD(P)-dependent oxidoreductase [Piscinibacter sp.]|uniref:SDR family NAD(P)-dependent oxidoreductase n=1 Tax=Piscinibacter sp. TaxID=1903157 RepID=UPI00258974B6|nr:SDR family NAD(P)-dependent oxidoreductase [Piscinibacter sp.]MCW5666694.1 SDR family NAD(P)-dependent oxidoreductase [Piscinibacter sp.]